LGEGLSFLLPGGSYLFCARDLQTRITNMNSKKLTLGLQKLCGAVWRGQGGLPTEI